MGALDVVMAYVKQVFVCSVLGSVLVQLMPEKKYAKYMSYLCGLLILFLCIRPLAVVVGKGDKLDLVYEIKNGTQMMQKLEKELSFEETNADTVITSEAQQQLEKLIDEVVLAQGYVPAKVAFSMDIQKKHTQMGMFGQVQVWASKEKKTKDTIIIENIAFDKEQKQEKNGEEKMLQNKIAEALHMEVEQIAVYIIQ